MKVFAATLALAFALVVQSGDASKLDRQVSGQVLTSNNAPAVQITFDKSFKYAGGQRFILYGVAEAEQHFFVQTGADGRIQRFYWLQFEHYLPSNDHKYDYPPKRTVDIGGLTFVHDTAVFSDYAGMKRNPDSDGGKAVALMTKTGALPATMARIRMFHLPDSSRRSELMIIYGETLDEKAPPGAQDGVSADEKMPELAARMRRHASEGMRIEKR